jgi:hypothetical protein
MRFDRKCEWTVGGCIEWVGYRNADGYGKVTIKSLLWSAHQAAYVDVHGPIPDGILVRHKCDNPSCVNVQHLCLGTSADNAVDRAKRGRSAVKLTDDQVREIRTAGGKQRAIAQLYSISPAAVCLIKAGKRRIYVEA